MIILTDIEGTTSSISFVRETLFPYARQHLPEFIDTYANDDKVAPLLESLRAELGNARMSTSAIAKTLQQWIDEDRKHTILKALQGLIWRNGYVSGAYTAHVYADAYQYLYRWYINKTPQYIYSSGSIGAQKLFFSYADFGDMSWLFNGYFDTTSGPKQDAQSYHTIASAILSAEPNYSQISDILFLSDIAAELIAAQAAGMTTCQLVRPQDNTVSNMDFPQASTFAEVNELFFS